MSDILSPSIEVDAFDGVNLLTVDTLTVDFPTADGVVHAVRGVSYTLRPGEVLGIVGESGSGKSVSSMAVMGLLPRTAKINGSIKFRGEELLGLSERELMAVRGKKIAMIFQDPMTSLNPVYKVGFQLEEAVLAHNDIPRWSWRASLIWRLIVSTGLSEVIGSWKIIAMW